MREEVAAGADVESPPGGAQRRPRRPPRGFVLLASMAILDVLLGYGREAVVAYHFGASGELDAFLVATTVPRMLAVQTVQITITLILPLYIGHVEAGRRDLATALMQRWFRFLLKAGVLFALVSGLLAPQLIRVIAPGLGPDQIDQSAGWFRLLLPWVVLAALAGCFKVVLESNRKFLAPALSGDLISVTVMVACPLLAGSWGVSAMVPGFLIGAALAFLIQWLPARRIEPRLLSFAELPASVKLPLVGGGILVVHSMVNQANLLIDRAFASSLPDGSIAALNYAQAINQAPSSVLTAALATALFPTLARMSAKGKWRQAFRTAMIAAAVTVLVGVLIAVPLMFFRQEVVELMFERGKFDAAASELTATVLSVLPLMIPIAGGSVLLTRLLMSQRRLRTILVLAILSICVKIVANILLVPRWGLQGVVMATVAAGLAALLARVVIAWRTVPAQGTAGEAG